MFLNESRDGLGRAKQDVRAESLQGCTCGESQRAGTRVAAIDWHWSFRILRGFAGSWAAEQNINIITWELPSESLADMIDSHTPVRFKLITGDYESEVL
jgi:hypothetical protein